MAEQDSAQKGKEEYARNGDTEKGIPQHVPKRMADQKLSKESEPREGKNEKNGKGTYQGNRDRTCSICKRAKQRNPGYPEKLHYKRRGRVVKKAARKKGKKHKKKKFSRKNHQKNPPRKKNTKGRTKYSDIL